MLWGLEGAQVLYCSRCEAETHAAAAPTILASKQPQTQTPSLVHSTNLLQMLCGLFATEVLYCTCCEAAVIYPVLDSPFSTKKQLQKLVSL